MGQIGEGSRGSSFVGYDERVGFILNVTGVTDV